MQFIPEQVIDEKASELGAAKEFSTYVQSLKAQQPALLGYLFSASFDMLTQAEKEYTMFLSLVIWASVLEHHSEQKLVSPEQISAAEEQNWQLLQDQKVKSFRDKITVFFDSAGQEDLLAFVEDSLEQDEDNLVTKEGREYIFVALKTIIDCLDQNLTA